MDEKTLPAALEIGSDAWVKLVVAVGPQLDHGRRFPHRHYAADCFVADLRRMLYEVGVVQEWPEHWGAKPRNHIDNDDAPRLASCEMMP